MSTEPNCVWKLLTAKTQRKRILIDYEMDRYIYDAMLDLELYAASVDVPAIDALKMH